MAMVVVTRRMTRKDGNAKATVSKVSKVKSSPNKVSITNSKKVVQKNAKSS